MLGIYLLAARKTYTLILVHRQPLLEQWRAQLEVCPGVPSKSIGQIGGGRRKVNGVIDVAMVQSLARKESVDNIVAQYGQVIVDECHHLPAVSFERVLSEVKARFIGEGFDDAWLDTLFLALPIAWKGTLVQYVRRLHRTDPSKREVRVVDYVDNHVPVLAWMFEKRLRGYRAMGYRTNETPENANQELDFEGGK